MVRNEAEESLEPLTGEPGDGSSIPGSDVLPHLDALVPSDISAWGVVRESCRLISQHLKSFLLPMLLLALPLALHVFWFQSKPDSHPGWGSFGSVATIISLLEKQQPWVVARCLAFLLLSCLAQSAVTLAVVSAYLKELNGDDWNHSSDASVLAMASARCLGTVLFALLFGWAIFRAVVVASGGVVAFIIPGWQVGLGPPLRLSGLFLVLFLRIGVLLVVAVPAAALSTAWGIPAFIRSSYLTGGNRMYCFALKVAIVELGSVAAAAPIWLTQLLWSGITARAILILAGVSFPLQWLVTLIWYVVRTVLYLKLRACHKMPLST